MEENNIGSKDEQDESEKERMQIVRGQVATILENYYEDTLVAPSGSAMAELVDKTSLKASQITSWYYRRKRKGSPHCSENSWSDSDKASSDSSKREGHAGPSKRAKFPASTVSKVEELYTQLNGVLPSQKELDAFSAELNLTGSQVYAWWYRHKARLEKNGKEQQESSKRAIRVNGTDSDPNKHSPSPSTGMDYAAWSALRFGLINNNNNNNNNNVSTNNSIDTNGQRGESSVHAQAQRLAAALMHRVDKHTLQMHYTNAHVHAHPSQMPGGVSMVPPPPLDADALRRMLHAAAGPLSLFNYSALDSARSVVTALDPTSSQTALKLTASVQQQQAGQSVVGPGFDNNSCLTTALLRTLQPNTVVLPLLQRAVHQDHVHGRAQPLDHPHLRDPTVMGGQEMPQHTVFGAARVHPGAGTPLTGSPLIMGVNTTDAATAESAVGAFMMNANPATKHMMTAALAHANQPGAGIPLTGSPLMGLTTTAATTESAVGAFMMNANPATKHMVTAALAHANRPTANPMGTPFGFAKHATTPVNTPVGVIIPLLNNNNNNDNNNNNNNNNINNPPPGIVKPAVCGGGAQHPLLSAFMSTTTTPNGIPMVGALSQQWLANMLATNLTHLNNLTNSTNLTHLASLPAAPGTDQVSHQRPPSHLPPQYPPPRAAMLAALHQPAVAHPPPVVTDNAAAMTQTILALQFALQSAQAARDDELRRPPGGQSAFNGNFNDGGCYSWSSSGSSAPFLPNSR